MERSRRTHTVSAKGQALAALADLKKNGGRRSEQFQLKAEDDVYDDVDEATYQELVKKRREDNFIEDDAGDGAYVDFGQEDWDDEAYSGDEGQATKRAKVEKKRGVFNSLAPKPKKGPTERVSGMFLGGGRDVIGGTKQKSKSADDGGADALLDSLLGEIEQDPLSLQTARSSNPFGRSGAVSAVRQAMPTFRPKSSTSVGSIGANEYARAPPRMSGAADESSSSPPAAVAATSSIASKRVGTDLPRRVKQEDDVEAGGIVDESSYDQPMDDFPSAFEPEGFPPENPAEELVAVKEEVGPVKEEIADVGSRSTPSRDVKAEPGTQAAGPRVVPFMAEEAAGTGIDWFQVVDEGGTDATKTEKAEPSEASQQQPMTGTLPPLEPDDSLHFFWLDAYEDNLNAPGNVFLFGKVRTGDDANSFASCCVSLKGMERNVFILPREKLFRDGRETDEPVTFVQVYQEVQQLCRRHKISKFGVKRAERNYAFEDKHVPPNAQWMKLVYSAEFPPLPTDTTGATFSKIYGARTSSLELLLLKRRIMGPAWLKLTSVVPNSASTSWCRFDVSLTAGKKAVSVLQDPPPPPPLRVASLAIQTVFNAKHAAEIAMASVIMHESVAVEGTTANPTALTNFSVVRKLDKAWPWDLQRTIAADKRLKIEVCPSERALLNFLIARLHNLDADVLVGHNIASHAMAVLLQRMSFCKIQHWSKVGRMRVKTMPKLSTSNSAFSGGNWESWQVVAGRLMCDTFLSARELLGSQRSYGLKELARTQLNANKPEVELAAVPSMFDETASLLQLVRCCENDAFLSLQLMFKMQVLPLTKQLTALAGNLWSKSLQGKRAERIEYLLLHEFHRLKYIVPDKETLAQRNAKRKSKEAEEGFEDPDDEEDNGRRNGDQTGRRKPAYAGGLVLEPKRGFYDHYVLLLDFNSLYPSIVQEYNICFTTVSRPTPDPDGILPLAMPPPPSVETGVLPRLIGHLVARRREVKSILKAERDPARRAQLDIRQKALKIMANSMYGCLGFSGSRFYARALAELITSRGRDALQHAVDIATNQNMEVIYGDTDSVMVNSATDDLAAARKMADVLKREVNKHYRCMEIDIDGVMKSMLLLKKKKYAALMVEEKAGELQVTRETKGLDLVRRDWCTLSRTSGSQVLDFILSGKPREEVISDIQTYLRGIAEKMQKNELGIEQYIITKQLTKAPQDYPDAKNQPHVQVAKRMVEEGQQAPPGTVIEYVICSDEGKGSVADRAYHPKVVLKAGGALEIDMHWYLAQQLHPPIWRLCEPIEGLDSAQIAEWLGLDSSRFISHSTTLSMEERQDDRLLPTASELQRFAEAQPLSVKCAECSATSPLRGVLGQGVPGQAVSSSLQWLGSESLKCSECGAKYATVRLKNALALAMRTQLKEYYTAPLQCEEPSCRETSRSLSTFVNTDETGAALFPACTAHRCKGRMLKTFTDRRLHTQLLFYKTLFDVTDAWDRIEAEAIRTGKEIDEASLQLPSAELAVFDTLKQQVVAVLANSAFDRVDFSSLFGSVFKP